MAALCLKFTFKAIPILFFLSLSLYNSLHNLNTESQKKGSSSGDQFQIFQIFCYGVMERDGLTTLRPKKVRPDPLAGRPGPL